MHLGERGSGVEDAWAAGGVVDVLWVLRVLGGG